jgi:diaminopimelate epimerase
MRFAKYQGIGNDFIMIADAHDQVDLSPDLVRRLCDRRFGIGADGVIRVGSGRDGADLFMDYVNSDGSVGEMCGNGIRCLALFARAEGLSDSDTLRVSTRAGVKAVDILSDGKVRVDMGPPIFAPREIPVRWEGSDALHVKLDVDLPGSRDGSPAPAVVEAACLSMGNPHAVLFCDNLAGIAPRDFGPPIERNELFPNRVNVEFVQVVSPRSIEVKVWERGAGETLACGTGACAAAVAARLLAATDARVEVTLPGGVLSVSWEGSLDEEAPVFMTGPAVETFAGTIDLGSP